MQQTQQRANDVKIGKTGQSAQTVKGWLLTVRESRKRSLGRFVLSYGVCGAAAELRGLGVYECSLIDSPYGRIVAIASEQRA